MSDVDIDQDVVQIIKQQHEEVKRLFASITDAPPEGRSEPFQCLVRLLAVHETAEEEVVHPQVRRVDGGEGVVQRRLDEESEAKKVLASLEDMDPSTDEFLAQIREFQSSVVDHAEHEEQEELPLLSRTTDQDQRRRMASALQTAESMAPTHPHPHAPETATGNLVVGPFAAIADRVRDALRSDS